MLTPPRVPAALVKAGILAVLGSITVACSRPADRPVLANGTPLVIVSIDTLRSDRLPAYGYEGVETPAIDSFARGAILFEHAYSPVPLTLPAHASLLTGLDPPAHRVRDNAGYRLDAANLPYLPSILKGIGYHTGAAVSSWVMRGTTGLASDFDFYEDHIAIAPGTLPGGVQRPGSETLAAASEWLGRVGGEPFFLLFHIYEPHAPHAPESPFDGYPEPYDGEVATADAVVGGLFDALRTLGVYDRSLIVLLSDHGEGLYDHGDLQHGLLLYREALQVPLLLKLPGSERGGTRVAKPASLVDVLPTVLELLGADPPDGLDGESLLSARSSESKRPIYGETAFPLLHFGWSELNSVIEYPLHLIYGPDPELYDLESDPGEKENLIRPRRREATRLRGYLTALDLTVARPAEEDEETRKRLAALGYLGTARDNDTEGPRADPKSRIHVLERLRLAFDHYDNARFVESERELRVLVTEEPLLVDAWEQLGHSLTAQNRFEESLEPFERAMQISEGAPQVAGAIAAVLLRLGRLDEARRHAEMAVRGHELSRDVLAQIAIRQGDLESAEGLVARALDGRGARLGPLLTQGELRFAQNRHEEVLSIADRLLDEAETRGIADTSEELRGVHFLRGSAFARLRRFEESAAAYRKEIELFPSELSAFGSLALVSLLQGKPQDAAAALELLLDRHPTAPAHAEAVRTLRKAGDDAAASRLLNRALEKWPADDELRRLLDSPPR